jgi:hypothetical protein
MNERIKQIMQEKGLTTTVFAGETGINPATLSFILNGRIDENGNRKMQKPSLKVLARILETYPDINPDWLYHGSSPMYNHDKQGLVIQPDLFAGNVVNSSKKPTVSEDRKEIGVKTLENTCKDTVFQEITPPILTSKKIDKIMIFYSDNTFESFSPDK